MSKSTEQNFYNLETIGGLLLFFAALAAIVVANSPLHFDYEHFLNIEFILGTEHAAIKKPLVHWVNDGLMVIYFLLIGLEIKREARRGILNNKTSIIVPAITATCGLLLPAAIYVAVNMHHPEYLKGWAIPSATDIAFSLGILSLLSKRVPLSLKILLTAIAIFDDIGAIAIIAVFYTKNLSIISLILALIFTLVLVLLNNFNCKRPSIYVVIGIALWAAVLESGVHATLAGIIIAMTIPDTKDNPMLEKMENGIHPWVVFFILPMFAFVNAGVRFIGFDLGNFIHPVVIGVALGLFIGKQLGIFLPLRYFIISKGYLKEDKIRVSQVYGLALVCGIGFTMSLFIGLLAFQNQSLHLTSLVKIGVLAGSLLSGLAGYIVLRRAA